MSYPRLTDAHFFYPDHLAPNEVVQRIRDTLDRAANQTVWANPALYIANLIERACFVMGVNPAVILVAFEREQSLLSRERPQSAWRYACGVVGQDGPGTVNPRWDGLPTQILLCAELNAWYIGQGPDSNFGYRPGLWPSASGRWPGHKTVDIYDAHHNVILKNRVCASASEYAQLIFTPHLGLGGPEDTNTLDVNAAILAQYVPAFA